MADLDSLLLSDREDHARNPSPTRRDRIRTMNETKPSEVGDATLERIKRNTDSMLEDVKVAPNLKKRLDMRREQVTKVSLKANDNLSSFIMDQIMAETEPEGSAKKAGPPGALRRNSTLDALASTTITSRV